MGTREIVCTSISEKLKNAAEFEELEMLLMNESNLPGPRGNLEVAAFFADQYQSTVVTDKMWELLLRWVKYDERQAGTNDPRVFLPFCAIQAMGALYIYANEARRELITIEIVKAMNDTRWRIREGAAMSLQRIGEKQFVVIQNLFERMYDNASLLEKRAFVAAMAHPPLLKQESNTRFSINLSERILDDIVSDDTLGKSEDYRVLSKGLEYALSVFVEKLPVEGFALLNKYSDKGDKRINKIIKSNLGKSRIAKKYSDEVEHTIALYGF
ncbi:hypothetical protein D3C74_126850 [compost metagenome]